MFQGLFEWVMSIISYILSFFGIIISKAPSNDANDSNVVVENTDVSSTVQNVHSESSM